VRKGEMGGEYLLERGKTGEASPFSGPTCVVEGVSGKTTKVGGTHDRRVDGVEGGENRRIRQGGGETRGAEKEDDTGGLALVIEALPEKT